MKAGDKVYAVYDGYGGPVIETAVVAKASEKQVTLAGRPSLGFGCCLRQKPENLGRSPLEAWEQWRKRLTRDREHALSKAAYLAEKLALPMPKTVEPPRPLGKSIYHATTGHE